VRSAGALGAVVVITALAVPSGQWPVVRGWVQPVVDGGGPVVHALSEALGTVILFGAATVVLIFTVMGKVLELRDRRAAEGIAVQGEIANALNRDPALHTFPMTPTARVPLWRGTPVKVKVVGKVPSVELRKAALRAAERGASDLLVRVRIKSRIVVVKSKSRRSARAAQKGRPGLHTCRVDEVLAVTDERV
jgi:hypothetical protein